MYVNLRRYPGIVADKGAIARSVRDGLLPQLGAIPGFEGYCAFRDAAGGGVSITVFKDHDAALSATDAARRWVMRNQDFFPERGEEFSGACMAHELSPALAPAAAADRELPYVLVRELANVPRSQDTLAFVQQRTLPMITRSPGFLAAYTVRGDRDDGRAAVVTVFEDGPQAAACHDRAVALLKEGLPGVAVTQVLQGRSTVFTMGK